MILECDLIIAIDPGISNGGMVDWRGNAIEAVKCPSEPQDIMKRMKYLFEIRQHPIGIIERVGHFGGSKDSGGKKFNIDKLARHAERLKSGFSFAEIPYVQVSPVEWQKVLNLKKDQEDGIDYSEYAKLKKNPILNKDRIAKIEYYIKKARKDRYKVAAQHYYPQIKATNWNCDAILLIELMRRKLKFDPQWILDKLPKEAQAQLRILTP